MFVLLNTNCKPYVVSLTLYVNLTIVVIPLLEKLDIIDYNVAIIVTYKLTFIQISIIHDNIFSVL